MKAAEFRELTIEELREKEKELSDQLFGFRLKKVTGQLEAPAKLRAARKDLARLLTVIREKAI